jgi:Beta-lactamase enzyme family
MQKHILSFLLSMAGAIQLFGQPRTDQWLFDSLYKNGSPQLKAILSHPETYHYQIIYTRIDRNSQNVPRFTNFCVQVDPEAYFNPASTVKLPAALVALEKINSLKRSGVTKYTTMVTDSGYQGETAVLTDTSSETGLPSVANYIKKIFLVSDNDAYNRLYEFDGQEELNRRLHELGYSRIRITRRFAPANELQNRYTNPISFYEGQRLLYRQPLAYSRFAFDFHKKILVGKGHWDEKDSLINTPMDFTTHNNLPLEDLQQLVQSVMFPNSMPKGRRFNLREDDYRFLYRYMSMLPSESRKPSYDTAEYFDSYAKFFFKAGRGKIPEYIRIYNKPGWSFGYLTDAAYVVDFKNEVEFMLAATIYVNSDGILNDNRYEYEQIGYPFFHEVFDSIYHWELKRERKYRPKLPAPGHPLPGTTGGAESTPSSR